MRFKIAFGYNYCLDIAEGWVPGNYDRYNLMLQLAAQNTQLPSVTGADYRCYTFNVRNNYFLY